MSLSKLNHDCLLGIFQAMPSKRKLAFRLVSNLWSDLLVMPLRKRKTLAICTSKHADHAACQLDGTLFALHKPEYIPSHRLNKSTFLPSLVRLFPNIQKLQLFPFESDARQVGPTMIRALELWQHSLVTVAFNYYGYNWCGLWSALAAIPTLRHLHLRSATIFIEQTDELAAIFGRLESFSTLYAVERTFLHHLGPNLTKLHLTLDTIFPLASHNFEPPGQANAVRNITLTPIYTNITISARYNVQKIADCFSSWFPLLEEITIKKESLDLPFINSVALKLNVKLVKF